MLLRAAECMTMDGVLCHDKVGDNSGGSSLMKQMGMRCPAFCCSFQPRIILHRNQRCCKLMMLQLSYNYKRNATTMKPFEKRINKPIRRFHMLWH